MNISVIIPTYKRLEFTKKAIESVVNQTYKPKEIIVVDDGSNEDLSSLKKQYPQITLLSYPINKGVSCARNFGIKNSSCEWIAFLDSDDIWLEDKLQQQVNFHKQNTNIKISQTQEIWVRNNKTINQPKFNTKLEGNIFLQSIQRCIITPSSVMIHKDIFAKVGVFDESLIVCEDYDLWLRITRNYQIGLVKQNLIKKYAGHINQLSYQHWGMDRFRIIALEKHLKYVKYNKEIKNLLIKKYTILINGAKKRQNIQIQIFYQEKLTLISS